MKEFEKEDIRIMVSHSISKEISSYVQNMRTGKSVEQNQSVLFLCPSNNLNNNFSKKKNRVLYTHSIDKKNKGCRMLGGNLTKSLQGNITRFCMKKVETLLSGWGDVPCLWVGNLVSLKMSNIPKFMAILSSGSLNLSN